MFIELVTKKQFLINNKLPFVTIKTICFSFNKLLKLPWEIKFQDGDWLVFGKESVGLSKEILAQFDNHLTIPMSDKIRSFNIANSVAFVISEAKRQLIER